MDDFIEFACSKTTSHNVNLFFFCFMTTLLVKTKISQSLSLLLIKFSRVSTSSYTTNFNQPPSLVRTSTELPGIFSYVNKC